MYFKFGNAALPLRVCGYITHVTLVFTGKIK